LLAGQLPYNLKGKVGLAVARVISEEEPAPLGSINKACRGDLEAILDRALEKDKARRYQSAADLASDIERYLNDEPVKARPVGAVYKSWKFAKRNKVWLIPVGLLLFALLVGIPVVVIQRERANQAEKANARLEAEGFTQAARLAAQQGNWRKALEKIDQALEAGHPDRVGLAQDRVRALMALNDVEGSARAIEVLAAAPDLGDKEGSVLLLQGEVLLGRDDARAEQHIRLAQEKGLTTGEAAYARALLAEKTPDAVELLQQTLALDPSQLRARSMLTLLLILLARLDEARIQLSAHEALFPEDANAKVLRALLATLERKPAEANGLLDGLRGTLGEKKVAALRALMKLLAEFRNPENPLDLELGLPDLGKQMANLGVEFPGFWQLGPGNGPDDVSAAQNSLFQSFPLPPLLRKSFVEVLITLSEVVLHDQGKHIKELTRAVEVHPEGTLLYIRAKALFGMGELFWEESRKGNLQAARTPALFPIRKPALLDAAVIDAAYPRTKPDPARQQRVAENLRAMVAEAPNGVPYKPGLAVNVASAVQEYDIARLWVYNWQRQAPNDPEGQLWRAVVDFRAQAYGCAMEAAEKVLQQPGDTERLRQLRDKAGKIKQDAGAKLKEQLQRLVPAVPDKPEP
jgi:tetratricopeptide (TPR) repeat protein